MKNLFYQFYRPFLRLYNSLRRHILIPFLEGNFSKSWHFIKANFRRRLLNYPYVAIIETGNYCNLRCPTCPTPQNRFLRTKMLMSFYNFKMVIDEIKDFVHVALLYDSNEPLLSPDIFKMVKYAHENNLYTEISTNATLLNEEKAKQLFESGLDKVILDLDGTSKQSYEQFRVGANFETVMKNIRYICQQKQILESHKPFIELQFILNKLNQHQVKDIKKLASELKVDGLSVKTFALGEYAYSREEIKNLSEKFFPDYQEYQQKIRYNKEGDRLKIKNPPKKCILANSHVVILTDGRVSMCCYDLDGKYIYGNIFSKSFKDIWFDPKAKKMRKMAKNRRYPLCKLCSIYD